MLTEKQLNSRSSVLPIEDIFTDADVNPSDYDMHRGYKFDYPTRWMNDPSEYKRIGIRRLDVSPTAHTYNIGVMIYDRPPIPSMEGIKSSWTLKTERTLLDTDNYNEASPLFEEVIGIPDFGPYEGWFMMSNIHVKVEKEDSSEQIVFNDTDGNVIIRVHTDLVNVQVMLRKYVIEGESDRYKVYEFVYEPPEILTRRRYETITYNFSWIPSNSMEEILKETCMQFSSAFKGKLSKVGEGEDRIGVPAFIFTFQYNHRTGELDLSCRNPETMNYIPFTSTYNDTRDRVDASSVFNQKVRRCPLFNVNEDVPVIHLSNVWNRDRIFVHASFSETRRNIIGIGGDRYDTPSKFFHAPTNTSEFNIWFTTDGKNVILPLYCPFVIELCFLMNYKTAKIT